MNEEDETCEDESAQITVKAAIDVAGFLWPDFVRQHRCVFFCRHAGSNPPPLGDTSTGWESFVNHTHMFDEFANEATNIRVLEEGKNHVIREDIYDEAHPDFVRACKLGETVAKLWALKLKIDFPADRFRVYYTQYHNPIVWFHMCAHLTRSGCRMKPSWLRPIHHFGMP